MLSAINKRGAKATALATVGVTGGGTQAFFAGLPEAVGPGEAATLVWSAPGARVISISPSTGAALDLKGQGDTGSIEVTPAATTLYTLAADGTQKQVMITVTQALLDFSASKTLGLPGEPVTLSWKTSGATQVTVSSPGQGALLTETDPAKMALGTLVATLPAFPLGTLVAYVLTVEGQGTALTKTIFVVLSPAPAITTFTGPAYARLGQKFALAWTTTHANLVELSAAGTVFWSSTSAAEAAAGTLSLDAPAATTEYTLTAKDAVGGAPVTRLLTVSPIGAASVTSFTATPLTLAAGGTAVALSWNVPNARRLRITGSDGHTVVTARGPGAETGTGSAYPNGPLTYTLDADNTLDPPVVATQAVTVSSPAAFGPAVPVTVFAGNTVDLTWSIGTNAQLVGFPRPGAVAAAGTTGFVDIASTGTRLPFAAAADDATLTFTPVDFETFLFGNRVTGPVTVSTNGFFAFASTALPRATPVAIPNATIERNLLAPFWANLELGATSNVYWQVLNEAPERVLVVQFDKLLVKADASSELTFEARVHQTGVVTFEYKRLRAAALPSPVVGVQGLADGLSTGGAAANSSLTLFGPLSPPVSWTFNTRAAVGGFLKLASGYLKAIYTPPFVAAGDVAITEVLYQPSAAIASTGQWFEVTNHTSAAIDLGGWTLDFDGGATHTIASPLVVGPGSAVVLGQSDAGMDNDDVLTNYVWGPSFALQQPAGAVSLRYSGYSASASWNAASPNNGGAGVSINIDSGPFLNSTDLSTTLPHPSSCGSTVSFGSQTPQQKGTPGVPAGCFGYSRQSIASSYFDIAATGSLLVTGDENLGTLSLASNPFPHFGVPKSTATVSTNGWVALKTVTGAALTNRTLPSTSATNNGSLAILWDDLNSTSAAGSGVFSKRVLAGEDPNNPLPHWIIQWNHYTHYTANDDLNFQLKLFDTGVIEYHYATMTSGNASNYATGNSATVWLENPGGTSALVLGVNKSVVVPNSGLRFVPN